MFTQMNLIVVSEASLLSTIVFKAFLKVRGPTAFFTAGPFFHEISLPLFFGI